MEIAGGLALLLPNAVYDIWKRKISLLWTLLAAAAGIIWQVYMHTAPGAVVCSLLPGSILLLAGYLRKGSVGMGDALVMGALGIWQGLESTLWILGAGCLLMSLVCIPLLILHRIQRDSTLPFVPFLLLGQLLCWGLNINGQGGW